MLWMSGCVNADVLAEDRIGVVLTPLMGNRPDLSRTYWGADNGCFSRPELFTLHGYLAWLAEMRRFRQTCLFVTAPDVVCDARATWARSAPVLPIIRRRGYPAALVAQNGIQDIDIDWQAFDVLFIGGDTAWKLSEATYSLMAEAKRRGKWVHQGRVNSLRRLRAAESGGADSADGTFLKFGPDKNLRRVQVWLDRPGLWETLSGSPGVWRSCLHLPGSSLEAGACLAFTSGGPVTVARAQTASDLDANGRVRRSLSEGVG